MSRQKPRSAYWGDSTTSATVVIGTISRRLSSATSSRSALVRVAVKSAATCWMRSYSVGGIRPVITPSTKLIQSISKSLSTQPPSECIHSNRRAPNGPMDSPNRIVADT